MIMSIRSQQDETSDLAEKAKVLYKSPRLVSFSLFWFSLLHALNLVLYFTSWVSNIVACWHVPHGHTGSTDTYIDLRTVGHCLKGFNLQNALTLALFSVEGFKFINHEGGGSSTHRMISNAVTNVLILFVLVLVFSGAHMIAFGFRLEEYRDYRYSLLSTMNMVNTRKILQRFYEVYTFGPALYLVFLALFNFILGHLIMALWNFFKKRQRDFLGAIAAHIDKAQEHTLSSVESNMVRPMQEALSKMRTQIEVLQDKEGQNFLKRGSS
jgi:hypothetical protein